MDGWAAAQPLRPSFRSCPTVLALELADLARVPEVPPPGPPRRLHKWVGGNARQRAGDDSGRAGLDVGAPGIGSKVGAPIRDGTLSDVSVSSDGDPSPPDRVQPRAYHGVMVSSTFRDLQQHRGVLSKALAGQSVHPVAMEQDSALPAGTVVDSSLHKVRDAAAYIGIIGHSYGQIPTPTPTRNGCR